MSSNIKLEDLINQIKVYNPEETEKIKKAKKIRELNRSIKF